MHRQIIYLVPNKIRSGTNKEKMSLNSIFEESRMGFDLQYQATWSNMSSCHDVISLLEGFIVVTKKVCGKWQMIKMQQMLQ